MLKPVQIASHAAGDARFAIVASSYNAEFVDPMIAAAKRELARAGAKRVQVVRVPGAYEVPIVAARLARQSAERRAAGAAKARVPVAAIICLGVILRGETSHAAHIGEAVSRALMEIQLKYEVPVIHEVLLLENQEQARVRCQDKEHNRGTEAAQTALAMARIIREI